MTEPVPLPLPALSEPFPDRAPARWPDAGLAVLVVLFAFLAASFPARNSDFWLHLATGRLLANGEYAFGSDPFAYTTEGTYWANHAWLFDLALYAGHQALGGAALVVLKALAIAVLAGLMLRLARPHLSSDQGGPSWVSGGCVLLAILAMSPRLLLQPACLSLLLLAGCLLILQTGGRALLALPGVIALWVNLDAWFLLGPLLVVLFGVGRWLGPASAPRLPFWLFPACALACLVGPHHVRALALPAELSPGVWGSDLRHDVRFAPLFASPWQLAPLGRAGGFSLAAWAYFGLVFLGLVSFALNRPALRSWRLPVWLAFGLLGAWQARLVPFFAVVAGPITALNLGERLPHDLFPRGASGAAAGQPRPDRTHLAGLAPGAVPPRPAPLLGRPHRSLAPPRGRHPGALAPAGRPAAGGPHLRHAPRRRPLLRLVLPRRERLPRFAPDALRAGGGRLSTPLSGPEPDPRTGPAPEASQPAGEWQSVLRDQRIACVVLYDPDLRRLAPALRQVALDQHWGLLRVDGQAILVAPQPTALAHDLHFDAERLAFAPAQDEALPPAPEEGPRELNQPLPWWQLYLDRPSGSSWEAGAAAVYIQMFQDGATRQLREQRMRVLPRHAAGLVGLAPTRGTAFLAVLSRLASEGAFLPDLLERPPALPLLGARAARGAVAEHPDDANAWLVLAQAYLALGRATPEALGHSGLPPLARMRHAQTVTALVQAVTLRPDLAAAHEALALLYEERQSFDLALKHRDAQLRLARAAGRLPGEEASAFAERMARLEENSERLRMVVQDSENRYVVRSIGLAAGPLARARLALELGLPGKALDDVLLRSQPDLYGVEGLRLLLDLLLLTGRAQDARDLLDRVEIRRNPDGLGLYEIPAEGARFAYRFPAYDWFDFCQAAAAGHYDRAASALERMRERMRREGRLAIPRLAPTLAIRRAAEMGLGATPAALSLRLLMRLEADRLGRVLGQVRFQQVERADLHVLEGMLLLERGQPGQASGQFRRSLELYRLTADMAPALPGQALALRYLEP